MREPSARSDPSGGTSTRTSRTLSRELWKTVIQNRPSAAQSATLGTAQTVGQEIGEFRWQGCARLGVADATAAFAEAGAGQAPGLLAGPVQLQAGVAPAGRPPCRPCRNPGRVACRRRVRRRNASVRRCRRHARLAPAAASMASARSSVRENRACSGHSTRPWWLVARAPGDLHRPVRGEEDGGVVARAVDHGDVVGHVRGDAPQHLDRVARYARRSRAGSARSAARRSRCPHLAPAEGQRHGQAGRVDAVRRTCDGLHGRDHVAAGPGAAQDRGLAEIRVEIVVADQERPVMAEPGPPASSGRDRPVGSRR